MDFPANYDNLRIFLTINTNIPLIRKKYSFFFFEGENYNLINNKK